MDEKEIMDDLEDITGEEEVEKDPLKEINDKLKNHDKQILKALKYIKTLAGEVKLLKDNYKIMQEQQE